MKLIIALIHSEYHTPVLEALGHLNVCVLSVSDVHSPLQNHSQQPVDAESSPCRLRIEVAAEFSRVNAVLDAFASAVGNHADATTCQVLVLPLEEWAQFPERATRADKARSVEWKPEHARIRRAEEVIDVPTAIFFGAL